ncbi:hypothetical protein B0H10DRAFT_828800 [Mycena sp. CBHHK59/15]|nr:hypothetical protein B0H10DRAFT_828800 [Mycena sp. CBHHK59/15]
MGTRDVVPFPRVARAHWHAYDLAWGQGHTMRPTYSEVRALVAEPRPRNRRTGGRADSQRLSSRSRCGSAGNCEACGSPRVSRVRPAVRPYAAIHRGHSARWRSAGSAAGPASACPSNGNTTPCGRGSARAVGRRVCDGGLGAWGRSRGREACMESGSRGYNLTKSGAVSAWEELGCARRVGSSHATTNRHINVSIAIVSDARPVSFPG